MKSFHLFVLLALLPLFSGCIPGVPDFSGLSPDKNIKDITNSIFTNRSAKCKDYEGNYESKDVKDVGEDKTYTASIGFTNETDTCLVDSDNTPNHSFNNGSNKFSTTFKQQSDEFRIPASPANASDVKKLSTTRISGIMLNGVRVDPLMGGCYKNDTVKTSGCSDSDAWHLNPMHTSAGHYNIDSHNATTQSGGIYVYLGAPKAMYYTDGSVISPVIGFAADGYPIYGPYYKAGTKAQSSYKLKSGNREGDGNPGGSYDGTYRNDYKYDEDTATKEGYLDECNGMTHDGQYGYYVTDGFPYTVNCLKGTPHSSFNK